MATLTLRSRLVATAVTAFLVVAADGRAAPADYFAIRVIDEATGRGVPLVELTTTFKARFVTDSAGYVAFNEPGLMGIGDVWFEVRSYGYESPKGAFGVPGIALKPVAGKTAEIRLKRTQIAERLYRQTGYGIYRDTVLLGKRPPIQEPLLNARVTGQDTVQTAIYKGKYYWFWQDTDQLGFGLGRFAMTGATATLPDKLDPDRGIDFTYFVDKPGEFARNMADITIEGTHPLWLDGMTVVPDARGDQRMICRYVAVDSKMAPVEVGLALFNDQRQIFERLAKFDGKGESTLAPSGKPYYVIDTGQRYACYPDGVRVPADFASASDPKQYEMFSPLDGDKVARHADGTPDWRWRRGALTASREKIEALVKRGELKADELPVAFRDADTGKPVQRAGGSIAWNEFLSRWTYVFGQKNGDSLLGEVWFATANSPEGPWRDARKIATHAMPRANYDLYNVIQHPELQREGGRYVYFEGTFVNTFGGPPTPTPYYNYNNLMYRIDLADPRLKLPEPAKGLTTVKPAD